MFLGTGASEGIPAMFCRCDYCNRARQNGGKDIRSRCSFRIDAKHQIDFSPDMFWQINQCNVDLFELEHILITHTHEDHLDIPQIMSRNSAVPIDKKPINIYVNEHGVKWANDQLFQYLTDPKSHNIFMERYRIIPTRYFEAFSAGELVAVPLKANHKGFGINEYAQNYLVQLQDGKSLLYATDTGWYPDETWEFLKGKCADIIIMEATFGGRLDRGIHPDGHLDVRSALLMLDKMKETGFVRDNCSIYITHINHKHGMMHEDLQTAFNNSRHKATVAWDGLRISNP